MAVNNFWFYRHPVWATDEQDLIDHTAVIQDCVMDCLMPCMNSDIWLQAIQAEYFGVGYYLSHTLYGNETLTGPDLGEPYPQNVSIVVSWICAEYSKWTKGRTYHPVVLDFWTHEGLLLDLYRNNLEAAYTGFKVGVNVNNWQFCVVSQWEDKVERVTAKHTNITSCLVRKRLDTQRRRLPRMRE
jgi:hypothetical protein